MNWFSKKARAVLVAVGLVTAVVIPSLACMGGGGADVDMNSPAGWVQGEWRIEPEEGARREAKIIEKALDPKATVNSVKLKPPMTEEEKLVFMIVNAMARDDPNNPELAAARRDIKIMLKARLNVTADKLTMETDEVKEATYTISASGPKTLTLDVLYNGQHETHKVWFEGKDCMVWTDPKGEDLPFKRTKSGKGCDEVKAKHKAKNKNKKKRFKGKGKGAKGKGAKGKGAKGKGSKGKGSKGKGGKGKKGKGKKSN